MGKTNTDQQILANKSAKMSETEEKFCCNTLKYPKEFLCCLSLEVGAVAFAVLIILFNITTIALASFHLNLDATDVSVLVDGGLKEVYSKTAVFYIYEKTPEDWEKQMKLAGGAAIATSILTLLLAVVGLIGIWRRTPILVYFYAIGVSCYIGFWIGTILGLAITADDFIFSYGLGWTLTIALIIVASLSFYFPLAIYSLFLKLCKEQVAFYLSHRLRAKLKLILVPNESMFTFRSV